MKIFRVIFAAVAAVLHVCAVAQAYPNRPITIVVPVPPGGIVDMAARLASEPLTRALGQPVVVDNRAGASGNIAYAMAARAKPDGYTLLASYSMYHVGNPSMFKDLKWSQDAFDPVAMIVVAPHVVVVHPSVPVNDLKELVEYARKNPGKISYASQGSGSVPHVGTELLKQTAGIELLHIPYRGSGPAIQDVLSGQVQLFITTPPSVIGHIKEGKLRALAVAGRSRHPMLPDVPTSAEQGFKDFELDAWVSLFAPAGTPAQAIRSLSEALEKELARPEAHTRAEQLGVAVRYRAPAQLREQVEQETRYWGQVIRDAGITAD